jgi:hypothetical protein
MTVGLTVPGGQTYTVVAVEVKGISEESQELTPAEDLATTGWTETPAFSKLNDASDATGVKSTLG